MSSKQALPAVLLVMLVLIGAQAKGQNLTYEDGYEDGVKAAKEDANQIGTYFSANPRQPIPPPSTMENIKDKPKQYREGFLDGYRSNFRKATTTSPARYIYIIGVLSAIGLAALLLFGN